MAKRMRKTRRKVSIRNKIGATVRGRMLAAKLGPTAGYEGYETVNEMVDVADKPEPKGRARKAAKVTASKAEKLTPTQFAKKWKAERTKAVAGDKQAAENLAQLRKTGIEQGILSPDGKRLNSHSDKKKAARAAKTEAKTRRAHNRAAASIDDIHAARADQRPRDYWESVDAETMRKEQNAKEEIDSLRDLDEKGIAELRESTAAQMKEIVNKLNYGTATAADENELDELTHFAYALDAATLRETGFDPFDPDNTPEWTLTENFSALNDQDLQRIENNPFIPGWQRDLASEELEHRQPWRDGGILQSMLKDASITELRATQAMFMGDDAQYTNAELRQLAAKTGNARYAYDGDTFDADYAAWLENVTGEKLDPETFKKLNAIGGKPTPEQQAIIDKLGYIPNRANYARTLRNEPVNTTIGKPRTHRDGQPEPEGYDNNLEALYGKDTIDTTADEINNIQAMDTDQVETELAAAINNLKQWGHPPQFADVHDEYQFDRALHHAFMLDAEAHARRNQNTDTGEPNPFHDEPPAFGDATADNFDPFDDALLAEKERARLAEIDSDELEALAADASATGNTQYSDFIWDELQHRNPEIEGGEIDQALPYAGIRELTALYKKWAPDTPIDNAFKERVKEQAARRGNDRYRNHPAAQEEYDNWLDTVLNVDDGKGGKINIRDGLYMGDKTDPNGGGLYKDAHGNFKPVTLSFEEAITNDMMAVQLGEEISRAIEENIGFLPNQTNFMKMVRGERPKQFRYSPDERRDMATMGGRKSRPKTVKEKLDKENAEARNATDATDKPRKATPDAPETPEATNLKKRLEEATRAENQRHKDNAEARKQQGAAEVQEGEQLKENGEIVRDAAIIYPRDNGTYAVKPYTPTGQGDKRAPNGKGHPAKDIDEARELADTITAMVGMSDTDIRAAIDGDDKRRAEMAIAERDRRAALNKANGKATDAKGTAGKARADKPATPSKDTAKGAEKAPTAAAKRNTTKDTTAKPQAKNAKDVKEAELISDATIKRREKHKQEDYQAPAEEIAKNLQSVHRNKELGKRSKFSKDTREREAKFNAEHPLESYMPLAEKIKEAEWDDYKKGRNGFVSIRAKKRSAANVTEKDIYTKAVEEHGGFPKPVDNPDYKATKPETATPKAKKPAPKKVVEVPERHERIMRKHAKTDEGERFERDGIIRNGIKIKKAFNGYAFDVPGRNTPVEVNYNHAKETGPRNLDDARVIADRIAEDLKLPNVDANNSWLGESDERISDTVDDVRKRPYISEDVLSDAQVLRNARKNGTGTRKTKEDAPLPKGEDKQATPARPSVKPVSQAERNKTAKLDAALKAAIRQDTTGNTKKQAHKLVADRLGISGVTTQEDFTKRVNEYVDANGELTTLEEDAIIYYAIDNKLSSRAENGMPIYLRDNAQRTAEEERRLARAAAGRSTRARKTPTGTRELSVNHRPTKTEIAEAIRTLNAKPETKEVKKPTATANAKTGKAPQAKASATPTKRSGATKPQATKETPKTKKTPARKPATKTTRRKATRKTTPARNTSTKEVSYTTPTIASTGTGDIKPRKGTFTPQEEALISTALKGGYITKNDRAKLVESGKLTRTQISALTKEAVDNDNIYKTRGEQLKNFAAKMGELANTTPKTPQEWITWHATQNDLKTSFEEFINETNKDIRKTRASSSGGIGFRNTSVQTIGEYQSAVLKTGSKFNNKNDAHPSWTTFIAKLAKANDSNPGKYDELTKTVMAVDMGTATDEDYANLRKQVLAAPELVPYINAKSGIFFKEWTGDNGAIHNALTAQENATRATPVEKLDNFKRRTDGLTENQLKDQAAKYVAHAKANMPEDWANYDRTQEDIKTRKQTPEALNSQLENVLNAGGAAREVIQPRIDELRATMKKDVDEATQDYKDGEIDLDTARQRVAAAKENYTDAVINALSETFPETFNKNNRLTVLSAKGDVEGQAFAKHAGAGEATAQRKEFVSEVGSAYPSAWVDARNQQGIRVFNENKRAYSNSMGYIAIQRDGTRGTAIHEVGHLMQDVIPGLSDLEAAYRIKRATKNSAGNPEEYSMRRGEHSFKSDTDLHPYTLKTYREQYESYYRMKLTERDAAAEVITVGMQALFDPYMFDALDKADILDFTLGAMLTLNGKMNGKA